MRAFLSQSRRTLKRPQATLMLHGVLLAGTLVAAPGLFAAGPGDQSHESHATPVAMPGWTQQLKGQTVVEEALEGRAGNRKRWKCNTIDSCSRWNSRRRGREGPTDVRRLQPDVDDAPIHGTGRIKFSAHDGCHKGEPVALTGGPCPAGIPVKQFDVSMINIEITLNRWLDFYPGYMYVLTENIEKGPGARKQRTKPLGTRSGFDPGAVTTGLQGDMIQPLVIRGNQGDCVKMTLRNQMEREDGSLHIQAPAWSSARPANRRRPPIPESIVPPGKTNGDRVVSLSAGFRKGCGSFTPIAMIVN